MSYKPSVGPVLSDVSLYLNQAKLLRDQGPCVSSRETRPVSAHRRDAVDQREEYKLI